MIYFVVYLLCFALAFVIIDYPIENRVILALFWPLLLVGAIMAVIGAWTIAFWAYIGGIKLDD